MRSLLIVTLASGIFAGGVSGCGGSDGPPDLTVYFRTTPYANAACNGVDQRLAGQRQMRLYTHGSVALPATTQGLASYYHRHSLSFFTESAPEATSMAYALDTNTVALNAALAQQFPGVDLSDEAALMASDPVLYQQVLTFVANFVLRPMVDFASTHSDAGTGVTNLVVIEDLESPGGQSVGSPGTTLAGLSISPALLAEFARAMPDEAAIWQGVNLPANFTPMMVLGDNVLSSARLLDGVLDDLVTAHEFGHSAALTHVQVELNLMYPSVTPGVDGCTDSLDDGQLATMSTTLGVGPSAASGALLAGRPGAAIAPGGPSRLRQSFAPARLRAMLAGDRAATRSFVDLLFHGAR